MDTSTVKSKNHISHDSCSDGCDNVVREEENSPPDINSKSDMKDKELHIAPMLDVTNNEFRYFMRILSRKVVLWTEMVVDETIIHSACLDNHLVFEKEEHPIVCQIGGNHPDWANRAARIIASSKYGYDEINLNLECPSLLVTGKEFGAALMKRPEVAVAMIESIAEAVATEKEEDDDDDDDDGDDDEGNHQRKRSVPVSVKTRIGVDDDDSFDFIVSFIDRLRPHCKRFVMHGRKVHTRGLNPAQNRSIPPLNYHFVYELCKRFPDCLFWLNGGIRSLRHAKAICYGGGSINNEDDTDKTICLCKDEDEKLNPSVACTAAPATALVPPNLQGVMIGRSAIDNPCLFWDADRYFYGQPKNPTSNRRQVLLEYIAFLERTYPRRCCDDDPCITSKFPAPSNIRHIREYCPICVHAYGRGVNEGDGENCCIEGNHSTTRTTKEEVDLLEKINSTVLPLDSALDGAQRPKVSSHVIDRALKPVLGIFYRMKGNKAWRRSCDKLRHDLGIRNCGPAFLLRVAMTTIPAELLDQDFVPSEEVA